MPRLINLSGRKFGKWYVLSYAGDSMWYCRCECGTMFKINGTVLRSGKRKRCNKCKNKVHRSRHIGKTYGNWFVLKYESIGKYLCRCNKCKKEHFVFIGNLLRGNSKQCNACHKKYPKRISKHNMSGTQFYKIWANLKKRGNICREWHDTFKNFYKDTCKDYIAGKHIIPIDKKEEMDATNYKWSTGFLQPGKTQIIISGITMSKAEWARYYGISRQGFDYRLKNGLIDNVKRREL